MVTETSIEQYDTLRTSGQLGEQQKKILDIISRSGEPLTDKEISEYNNININSVTGRRNELLKKGFIKDAGTRPCNITGNNSHIWTDNNSQSHEDNGRGNDFHLTSNTRFSLPVHNSWNSRLPPEYCLECGEPLNTQTGDHYCKFCKLKKILLQV